MSTTRPEPNLPAPNPAPWRWEGHMSDGVGVTYGMQPMASLTAEPDHLVLTGSRGTFRLPRAAVLKLSRGGFYPWFFRGIRIRHKLANFPPELMFRPMGAQEREVMERLWALGFGSPVKA